MEFHPDKCKILTISNKRKLIETNYYIHNRKLDQVDEDKYLGLIIHKKLYWSSHVNMIIKKANQTRAFLQRNLGKCHHDVKCRCYQISRLLQTLDLRHFSKKTHVSNRPTITSKLLLVVRISDIDHSYIPFVSGFILDICKIRP